MAEENIPISKLMTREDWKNLNDILFTLPVYERGKVKQAYKREFLAGMEAEDSVIKKDNAGRFRANRWLDKNYGEKK